ncbi:MAG: DUF2652 domain-containing protein [Maribacter sp.]|nr:DUF2652 domain-containing protein [Maribacter sp.]
MPKSLLFIPDISGFTKFVQTTEVEHSQHVISELLEVLISANTQGLELAEIEGDALFFYKEDEITSQEKLLAQIETMFTAFYGHLRLLEKNRICPCNACATAPNLELKVVAHSGDLKFIQVQGNRKPFGQQVIEAHRLLKNSVDSDNYALISKELANDLELPLDYNSKVYRFKEGKNLYDGKEIAYIYSLIEIEKLNLNSFSQAKKVSFDRDPNIVLEETFPIAAESLLEYITNFTYRHHWVKGVDKFEYNTNEVNRLGTEHVCVINGKQLNFVTVTKNSEPGKFVHGELTPDAPFIKEFYQFYIITPGTATQCNLRLEMYWETKSIFIKIMSYLLLNRAVKKNASNVVSGLMQFVTQSRESEMN